ncbi:MAG: pteridine reductase [Gammaproteobacteria bacterium]|nr:pteridine reductase [Gammaproteobacteria bacterium]
MQDKTANIRVALVTGAAKRLGAAIADALHEAGYAVVIHFNHSKNDALKRVAAFNTRRPGSALAVQADLCIDSDRDRLVAQTLTWRNRLDVLVNNASSFYPTPVGNVTLEHWDDLIGTNLKAPFFISQAARSALAEARGTIVNLADINAERPCADHPIYCAAKAGLVMLTKALARDLAPDIKVNAVAPGVILWPEAQTDAQREERAAVPARIPMGQLGRPHNVAQAVLFFCQPENYVTGQVLAVDGGLSQT